MTLNSHIWRPRSTDCFSQKYYFEFTWFKSQLMMCMRNKVNRRLTSLSLCLLDISLNFIFSVHENYSPTPLIWSLLVNQSLFNLFGSPHCSAWRFIVFSTAIHIILVPIYSLWCLFLSCFFMHIFSIVFSINQHLCLGCVWVCMRLCATVCVCLQLWKNEGFYNCQWSY